MKIIQKKSTTELSAGIKKYRAPGSVLHWHKNYEICQVISPSCRFLIDGKLINAEKGDIIAIKEHTLHKFLVDHDDTLILVIQFPLKILLNADIAILPLKTHISVIKGPTGLLRYCGMGQSELQRRYQCENHCFRPVHFRQTGRLAVFEVFGDEPQCLYQYAADPKCKSAPV